MINHNYEVYANIDEKDEAILFDVEDWFRKHDINNYSIEMIVWNGSIITYKINIKFIDEELFAYFLLNFINKF